MEGGMIDVGDYNIDTTTIDGLYLLVTDSYLSLMNMLGGRMIHRGLVRKTTSTYRSVPWDVIKALWDDVILFFLLYDMNDLNLHPAQWVFY